jgi:regulation of enolase protein 1 (concanavalin A-like superfamily)
MRPNALNPLRWSNAPQRWEPLPDGGLRIEAPGHSDYFRDPAGNMAPSDSAPYLWQHITGDFVAQALVQPHFASTYDSGCLMVRHDGHPLGQTVLRTDRLWHPRRRQRGHLRDLR